MSADTDDFAIRGWHRMIDLVDYISSFVDLRSVGNSHIEDADTYERFRGLATALKAAVQWFALDPNPKAKFVVEAERYLADGPTDQYVTAPVVVAPNMVPVSMRTGPVVPHRGGRGAASRQEEAMRIRAELVRCYLEPLTQRMLLLHQEAYRDPDRSEIHPETVLARVLAKHFLLSGAFTEMRLEQGFSLANDWDAILERVSNAVAKELNSLDLAKCDRDEFAEQLIRQMLRAMGIAPDKDLFRVRRQPATKDREPSSVDPMDGASESSSRAEISELPDAKSPPVRAK